jgi:hypothetical protein|tara:strand:+ start:348 stop:602 length:255 start_codon:yes stop_codon:yes gene_type:complete
MAGLSDQIKKTQEVLSEEELRKEIEQEVVEEQPKNLNTSVELTKDEITLILAKFAQLDFKGVEIELTYNLIVKLQNTYKQLLNK